MDSSYCTFSVTAIAEALAKNLSDSELAFLAAVFTQLGDTLATVAVIRDNSLL
jgi:HD-like signal output (HDOD) protein